MFRALSLVVGTAAAGPTMNFLHLADCGGSAVHINKGGIFNLSISVAGQNGFTHYCSTDYDPVVGAAKEDCIQWLPSKVLSDEEDLDITLRAIDADGTQATCMKWELVFDGHGSPKAWSPSSEHAPKTQEQAMLAMEKLGWRATGTGGAGPNNNNNTKEARHQSMYDHLDSMTHVSHRCAGKPQYWDGVYAVIHDWAFPSTGTKTSLHMHLSHALLAATGTIWSIDRACKDFLPGGFCVPFIPFLPYPHCHTTCDQEWALGPGGVASWGISDFTHHLPSPGIGLVQQFAIPGKQYNDKGCGDSRRVVV